MFAESFFDEMIKVGSTAFSRVVRSAAGVGDQAKLTRMAAQSLGGRSHIGNEALAHLRSLYANGLNTRSTPDSAVFGDLLVRAQRADGKRPASTKKLFVRRQPPGVKPWAPDAGIDPNRLVTIRHSGGLRHIQSFLSGKSQGYGLEHAPNTGLQVHPSAGPGRIEGSRALFYGRQSAAKWFDVPALLKAQVPAGSLQRQPNLYEAGLPAAVRGNLQNVRVRPYTGHVSSPALSSGWIQSQRMQPELRNRYASSFRGLV